MSCRNAGKCVHQPKRSELILQETWKLRVVATDEVEHDDESIEQVCQAVEDEVEVGRDNYDWEELDPHLRVKEVDCAEPCIP